ncbi:MAG TPA: peptidase domain-containing protein, partial [Thermomicrobiaceae bacterium]|nr:peptidase domain-containing protein [Thermomicrobiaceae bacterium]
SVFWSFMNSSGPVYQGGGFIQDKLFQNPYYATGYPITEAYWTTVKVGGVAKRVLVQVFERRVLTYTPSNPAGWQVESGNVGLQYHQWRYGN